MYQCPIPCWKVLMHIFAEKPEEDVSHTHTHTHIHTHTHTRILFQCLPLKLSAAHNFKGSPTVLILTVNKNIKVYYKIYL